MKRSGDDEDDDSLMVVLRSVVCVRTRKRQGSDQTSDWVKNGISDDK